MNLKHKVICGSTMDCKEISHFVRSNMVGNRLYWVFAEYPSRRNYICQRRLVSSPITDIKYDETGMINGFALIQFFRYLDQIELHEMLRLVRFTGKLETYILNRRFWAHEYVKGYEVT